MRFLIVSLSLAAAATLCAAQNFGASCFSYYLENTEFFATCRTDSGNLGRWSAFPRAEATQLPVKTATSLELIWTAHAAMATAGTDSSSVNLIYCLCERKAVESARHGGVKEEFQCVPM
ncbi:hypothetical protein F5J12DRAFT_927585 [Pisolithus orientalis]|uniref:uncharacterized protein n=1 Tax=Pisolithus orientalis TaxID=936130 RepID=UPI0022250ED4|nr:uncharacterized protein F5J12DRAFT_927585 [Pisolithus orientalis]KAI6006275.1 hypothetical protein F5J12DRAFT_927585 [Pisolithus orientalis]